MNVTRFGCARRPPLPNSNASICYRGFQNAIKVYQRGKSVPRPVARWQFMISSAPSWPRRPFCAIIASDGSKSSSSISARVAAAGAAARRFRRRMFASACSDGPLLSTQRHVCSVPEPQGRLPAGDSGEITLVAPKTKKENQYLKYFNST